MSESVISKDTAVEVKAQTIDRRRLHHGPSGNSPKLFPTPDLSGPNVSHSCWLPTGHGTVGPRSGRPATAACGRLSRRNSTTQPPEKGSVVGQGRREAGEGG